MKIELYTDGGARGNPGPAAAGIFIHDLETDKEQQYGMYLGETTNNQAEYLALISGLELISHNSQDDELELTVFMDSELIIKQLNGEYKVKDPCLKQLHQKVCVLVKPFPMVKFIHVKREKNKIADMLVNRVLDQQESIIAK